MALSILACGNEIRSRIPESVAEIEEIISTPDESFAICSELSFRDVVFPESFSAFDSLAFALALNITGSFEGGDGWANLTNNFDGQGLSMGLLNQTLGTGSLQPLLIKMRDNHFNTMRNQFEPSRFNSILSMIDRWNTSTLSLQSHLFSPLDEPTFGVFASGRNKESVNWAVSNLYNGSRFKAGWREDLTKLANTPEYKSIQVGAAERLHKRARLYQERIGTVQLRSYLMMYDIVVQNGSIRTSDFNEYHEYFEDVENPTETQRLKKILELRLRHVLDRWREDVRRRKTTIIEGKGFVHGSNRKLEEEYCYEGLRAYPTSDTPLP